MSSRKTTIVGVILLAALGVLGRWQWEVNRLRRDTKLLLSEQQAVEGQSAARGKALDLIRSQIAAERRRNQNAHEDVATAERAFAKVDPDSRWAEPPAVTPDWNAESPYVWIHKEMVPRFAVPIFSSDGQLQPGVSEVLALDPEAAHSLNRQLVQLMTDHHALEAASAKRTDKSLPGTQGPGTTVTVEIPPMPQEGEQFKARFEAVLRAELGEQRAALVLQSAKGWIERQFCAYGTEAKTISVIRHPNGGINVSIHSGQNWDSMGLPADHPELIREYIPAHLLPLFKNVLSPENSVPEATQTEGR